MIPKRLAVPALVLAALAALVSAAAPAAAQEGPEAATPETPTPAAGPAPACLAQPRDFEARRATSAIEVDGVLDEPAWQDALSFALPCEWNPGDNVAPPVETDFLVTYDDDNLYLAWRAFDPEPSAIRANLMDRDSINTFVQDDHVLLILDTFNDERRGFQLRVNPLGVQADALFSQSEGIEDFSYDMIWDSAGRITEEGYVVEVAVPFNQLRFPATAGEQTWGFDIGRSYPRSVRHRLASNSRERGNNCLLCQATKISGFEDLEPGRNLQVTPTITALRTDRLSSFPAGGLESGDEELEPGVTARWGVSPNVTLSGTLNPDFSQVEADVAQLAVNERFALFFPEKRPFFLEGGDLFTTPIRAVFTRTVADPRWGLKGAAKQGANAYGAFVTEDGVNTVLVPTNQGSRIAALDGGVTGSVVRFRRDFGAETTVGALYAGREGDAYHNRVFGLDAVHRFGPSDRLTVQILGSETRYPEALDAALRATLEEDRGYAFLAGWDHETRNWFWSASYQDLDPSFRADSGFVPRVDVREAQGVVQRHFWGEAEDFFNRFAIGLYTRRVEDHSGRLTDRNLDLYANFSGPLQSFAQVSLKNHQQFFGGVLYDDLWRGQLFAELQPSGALRVTLFTDLGETVDFQNNRPADGFQVGPSVELKLGRHVNLRASHNFRRLEVEGGELLEANLTELRAVYNLSTRTFVRAIFQYFDLQQDPALFTFPVEPRVEDLFTQLLFSYKVNPQTVLFLGYSDARLGLEDVSLTQTARTFFAKIGYAWTL
ncbi:MAG TPA: DUF5916 domain-containing protein [Thermoanaerobaculia bacterium]|nr:DUF5916 domain-containing protein [Thermoanaerobaculia bacterium]